MNNDIICKKYIDEYTRLKLFNNDLINDQQFLVDINISLTFTKRICDENKDRINPDSCKLLEKVDKILANYFDINSSEYNHLDKQEKVLAKKVVVQLIKRQIQLLIDIICKPCRKESNDKIKCKEYMNEFSKLNFLKNTYDYDSIQFINDLQIILDLILKINKENMHFSGIDELIKIDNDIYDYFIKNKNNLTDIRKIAAQLMIHQLYTIIITLCNFCKLTEREKMYKLFDSNLFKSFIALASNPIEFKRIDSQIRRPHNMGVDICIQASEITNAIPFLLTKLEKKENLLPNQEKTIDCILKSDREDDKKFQQSLKYNYILWFISKLESGALTTEEKKYTSLLLNHKGKIPKERNLLSIYEEETLKRFVEIKGISRPITRYDDLDDKELDEYYSKYFLNIHIPEGIKATLNIRKKQRDDEEKKKIQKTKNSQNGGILNIYKSFYKLAKKTYHLYKYNIFVQKLNNLIK
jgi:hypothetical protein